jgi:ubiquitin-protein ligase
MSPRSRRLLSDLRQMEEFAGSDSGGVTFRTDGNPPDVYHMMLNGPGLAIGGDGQLAVRNLHRCDIYLHLDYPRHPPVVTWLTPIFHPNILGPERNGGVCIGSWSAAESLADLCVRLRDLLTYRSINVGDPLNLDAASWALGHDVQPGDDIQELARFPIDKTVSVGLVGVRHGS